MWISGDQKGRVISCLTFTDRPEGKNVIVLDGVSNLTLDLLDFDGVPQGIYMTNSTNITIKRLRARDIYGPFTRTVFHSGDLIQFSNSTNIRISDLKVDQPSEVPANRAHLIHPDTGESAYGTEDIISIFGAVHDAIIERFAFYGGAWQSWSGTGFFVSDTSEASNVTIRDGVLYQAGQVGIGTGSAVGPFRFENIDIYSPRVCCFDRNGIEYGSNIPFWLNYPGAELKNIRLDWTHWGGAKSGLTGAAAGSYVELGANSFKHTFTQPELDAMRALTRVD